MIRRALTIAGSDSSGGAGIQADLKTFTVHEVYGASAITALTAQNTLGVSAVWPVPAEFVRQQIDAVLEDIGADVVKTGMLATAAISATVAAALRAHRVTLLVVDPVLVAQSGDRLLDQDAIRVVIEELLPQATLVTPNVLEAEALTGLTVASVADMHSAAAAICRMGAAACLVKGGHLDGDVSVDVLHHRGGTREFCAARIASRHTHGTGCQLSAAIAANLAQGVDLEAAVAAAKDFIVVAIRHGLALGRGAGPANPLAWRPGGRG